MTSGGVLCGDGPGGDYPRKISGDELHVLWYNLKVAFYDVSPQPVLSCESEKQGTV